MTGRPLNPFECYPFFLLKPYGIARIILHLEVIHCINKECENVMEVDHLSRQIVRHSSKEHPHSLYDLQVIRDTDGAVVLSQRSHAPSCSAEVVAPPSVGSITQSDRKGGQAI